MVSVGIMLGLFGAVDAVLVHFFVVGLWAVGVAWADLGEELVVSCLCLVGSGYLYVVGEVWDGVGGVFFATI